MASKTTLAQLKKLAKRKGLWIRNEPGVSFAACEGPAYSYSVILALYGPVAPVMRSALHAVLSALPDKERAR